MNRLMSVLLGLSLILGATSVFAQDTKTDPPKKEKKAKVKKMKKAKKTTEMK